MGATAGGLHSAGQARQECVLTLVYASAANASAPPHRYKIEQELGTEIKPIPPHIEEKLYCM